MRDAAVFEGVGKLITLADAHQELRLREELFDLQTGLLACSGERGEIHVGGEVLLAGGLIRVRARRVMPIRHERPAVATCELFAARVTVVDNQQEAACNGARDLLDPILRQDGHFEALAGFGMNAVAVEEFQISIGRASKNSLAKTIKGVPGARLR